MWKSLNVRIIGTTPLIMHNVQLADPLNPHARAIKEISKKRNKTDADFEELARREFLGGLYLKDKQPIVPSKWVEGAIVEAAKKQKGKKSFQRSFRCDTDSLLEFDGPKDPIELWNDRRFVFTAQVKVQRATIMRTRPIFDEWSCFTAISYDDNEINESSLLNALKDAGELCGFGDYRPKFGRFKVEIEK